MFYPQYQKEKKGKERKKQPFQLSLELEFSLFFMMDTTYRSLFFLIETYTNVPQNPSFYRPMLIMFRLPEHVLSYLGLSFTLNL